MESSAQPEDPIRDQALTRLKKKRDFKSHLVVYIAVNALLVGIWAVTREDGTIFWPIFPILGWGIGVAASAWDTYGRKPISEAEIQREADRLRGS